MLEFCPNCNSTMRIAVHESEVSRLCVSCNTRVGLGAGPHVLWEHSMGNDDVAYKQFLHASVARDATLPSMDAPCPRCQTRREIKYVKYGKGLKYLYTCTTCAHHFTNAPATGR